MVTQKWRNPENNILFLFIIIIILSFCKRLKPPAHIGQVAITTANTRTVLGTITITSDLFLLLFSIVCVTQLTNCRYQYIRLNGQVSLLGRMLHSSLTILGLWNSQTFGEGWCYISWEWQTNCQGKQTTSEMIWFTWCNTSTNFKKISNHLAVVSNWLIFH